MNEDVTFIVHGEWVKNIEGLPLEMQDKILADIVRYGVNLEVAYPNDPMISSCVNMVKNRIDFSKDKYNQKVDITVKKSAGRKKSIDDKEILRLALEGKNSKEIASILGYCKSTVDHSDGWKARKEFLSKK